MVIVYYMLLMLASKCNAYNTKQVDHILRPAPYTLHYNLHIGIDHSRKHHYKYIFINALIIDQEPELLASSL